ncbi:chromosome segregation protein SMC, partial [Imhoffiella purpurea]|uniref:chromosome segregation protein SMC n=1 Tax=Imhoffiella purpurea TaxID=1249627 RepID=UPI0005C25925
MRLEKIKLAGFKSFVDPTAVSFPSNLIGVVGPNGCGKSNVIDAVRWVMGESSAKMLRGESMADVIFNGSTGRKPVGVASIELIFDNGDGAAGGEYAAFNQISVKRQVSRDGQSSYFLNGSRCRRRDIQDLFLGTGLGPRSYAIIEQGTISRIIEARPEDLRLFLEEAAGISKYKERRRETENRMRHTRENLDRLDDLREEVGKQLQHLERQAATAEKYTQLKADERRLDQELKALRWRLLDEEIQGMDRRLGEAEVATEAGLARQRRLEADIEARRADLSAASDLFNEVQGRFYAVGTEIARAEQAIQFANEERGRREAELVRLEQEFHEANANLERDRQRLTEIDQELERHEPELKQAEAELGDAAGTLMTLEDRLKAWEADWDGFNQAAAKPAEQAQVERARINALEQSMGRDHERLRRLEEELGRLDTNGVTGRIEELGEREAILAERIDALSEDRRRQGAELSSMDEGLRSQADELARVRTQLQESKGRLASLAALQDAALADPDGDCAAWLEARGLSDAPRLVDRLTVEPGWERAVETLLGDALRAVGASGLEPHVGPGDDLAPGLMLFDPDAPVPMPVSGTGSDSLAERARSPWPLVHLLRGARVADSLADALSGRSALAADERWITREGIQVGPNWLATPAGSPTGGMLERAETIKKVRAEIEDLLGRESELLDREQELRAARAEIEQSRDAVERELSACERERSTLGSELSSLETRREHLLERQRALETEREELRVQESESIAEMEETRERLHALLAEVDALAERRESMSAERDRLRDAVAEARAGERACRDRAQGLLVNLEANRAARQATVQSLERAREQQVQLAERREALIEALEEGVEPLAEQRERL